MKLDDLLNCTNDNCMYLPYWIKILYLKENKLASCSNDKTIKIWERNNYKINL